MFSSPIYLLFPLLCKTDRIDRWDRWEELLSVADDNPKAYRGPIKLA